MHGPTRTWSLLCGIFHNPYSTCCLLCTFLNVGCLITLYKCGEFHNLSLPFPSLESLTTPFQCGFSHDSSSICINKILPHAISGLYARAIVAVLVYVTSYEWRLEIEKYKSELSLVTRFGSVLMKSFLFIRKLFLGNGIYMDELTPL